VGNLIAIVDHGMGNLGSVANMLRRIGVDGIRTADPAVIGSADKIVLAGIGAFDGAAARLADLGLVDVLNEMALERRVPILGVCLGMQLMARSSEEGSRTGLGWIDAEVRRFAFEPGRELPLPHMGWQGVSVTRESPLFAPGGDPPRYYFSHAYHLVCADQNDVAATANYGYEFPAAIQHENLIGTQFHPEKSHRFGLEIYRRFAGLEST